MDSSKAKKTGKPRIPDHLRRRALVSCDRCKKRRIRCLRALGSEDCQSCVENGVGCESTLPRKTRIYGSVETLSHRYRILDALIKGLYPNKDTNNIDSLYAIADEHGIKIPVFDEQSIAEEVFNNVSKHSELSPDHAMISERSPSAPSRSPEPANLSSSKVVEEKLVPLPYGPSHYIGPSSSFGFVLTVRRMVAELNATLRATQPDDERAKLSTDFAGSNWSKALEPISKVDHDESSDDQDAASQGTFRMPHPSSVSRAGSTGAKQLRKVPLLSLLPPREVTDAFVEAYFEKVHPNYLLFHRETFQARYETMWVQSNALSRDVESGWVCCVFMIVVFGAQSLEDRDKAQSVQIQRHYLNLVQSRMHELLSTTTVVNVQAILLLQLYQHNCTERNSAFMLLGFVLSSL
jgi:proline utilization trans-activator